MTTLIPYTFYTLMWFYGANRCPIQAQSVNFKRQPQHKDNYKRIAFIVNQNQVTLPQRPSPTHDGDEIHQGGNQPVEGGAVDERPRFNSHNSKQQAGNDRAYRLGKRL